MRDWKLTRKRVSKKQIDYQLQQLINYKIETIAKLPILSFSRGFWRKSRWQLPEIMDARQEHSGMTKRFAIGSYLRNFCENFKI